MEEKKTQTVCPYAKKCGGCQYQGVPYSAQLKKKQNQVQGLLKKFGNVKPVIGMKDPYFYRNKVFTTTLSPSFGAGSKFNNRDMIR